MLNNIKANQTITSQYKNSAGSYAPWPPAESRPVFQPAANQLGIKYMHQEKDAIDYNIQPILPHKLSQYGPCLAVGDIDNNGYDDFFVGGSAGNKGVFFMQGADGKFTMDNNHFLNDSFKEEEDMGALLFDANGDGFLDLYVVSVSYERPYHRARPLVHKER